MDSVKARDPFCGYELLEKTRGVNSMVKKTFRVTGMHCSNCAMRIEGLEDELEGVVSVRANYPKSLVEIEFDETRVGPAKIFEVVERMGYALEEIG